MNIHIFGNHQDLFQAASLAFVRQLNGKPASVLGLAIGSTQAGLYAALVMSYLKGDCDFSEAVTFNLDEYVGLSPSHPCSYHQTMHTYLFDHVNISAKNIHLPDGNAKDLDNACQSYEQTIARAGGIDLQLLGLGHNGHIGFNEPGTPLDSLTHVVTLTSSTLQANSRYFEQPDDMPRQAISMGIRTILQARKILLLALGEEKKDIVRRSLRGPVTADVPASLLQLHPAADVYLDEPAASALFST